MTPQSSRTEPNFHFAVERVPTSWKSEPVLRFGASLFWSKQFIILVDGYESVNDAPTPVQNRTSISRWNEFQLHGSPNLCSVGASLFLLFTKYFNKLTLSLL